MDSGSKPLHIYCPTQPGGSSGMKSQDDTFGYLKANKNWHKSQLPNSVYKTLQHGFSLKGREIKMSSGNTEIPSLPPSYEEQLLDYKHFDKDHLHSTATV
jgi:hypothetical protein